MPEILQCVKCDHCDELVEISKAIDLKEVHALRPSNVFGRTTKDIFMARDKAFCRVECLTGFISELHQSC
jgi:hypothetical protein